MNLLKTPGLTDIDFAALIPQVKYPFANYDGAGFVEANAYLNKLEQLKVNKEPFQFIISRCLPNGKLLFDTNLTVSLEDYKINEDAKNGFDLEIDIRLKMFRAFATKTIPIETQGDNDDPIPVDEVRLGKPNNGSLTKKQVKKIQKYLGVTVNGKFGDETRTACKRKWDEKAIKPKVAWKCYKQQLKDDAKARALTALSSSRSPTTIHKKNVAFGSPDKTTLVLTR
ncbi:MAG: hypothetical protein RSB98_02880 [Raoultibacter sp.]